MHPPKGHDSEFCRSAERMAFKVRKDGLQGEELEKVFQIGFLEFDAGETI